MKHLIVCVALLLPGLAHAAEGDPQKLYADLVQCYVAFEQDKADSAVRGDPARGAKRDAQIPPVLALLGQYGQALGRNQAAVQADMRAAMDGWFAGIASGAIDPASLPGKVAACEAWLKL